LSDGAYGNTADGKEQILALLAEVFDLQPVEAPIPGMGSVFLLERK
jgi:hypothetical protein